MSPAETSETLGTRFGDSITNRSEFRGELTLSVKPESLAAICQFCRDELSYDLLLDISSVDLFDHDPRYEVVYELYSLARHTHLRIKTAADSENPEIATVSSLWPGADWHEREIWDMMGIRFAGHPDLRRIIMWEGFPYHPLRKDFPLEGKSSDAPGVAFSEPAPLDGGPFVTAAVAGTTEVREPRARRAGDLPPGREFTAEP